MARINVTVQNNITLRPARAMLERKIEFALVQAAEWVKRTSNTKAPVDSGNLINSSYTRVLSPREIEIGYTAKYAAHVHEIRHPTSGKERTSGSGRGTYWETGAPKFLEKAIGHTRRIRQIMIAAMRF